MFQIPSALGCGVLVVAGAGPFHKSVSINHVAVKSSDVFMKVMMF